MVLSDLRIGQCARILRVNGSGELRRRLLDMGLTPNTIVKLVRVAPLGDPIELCLRGYNLSLREEAARDIEVELLPIESSCGCSCHSNRFRDGADHTLPSESSITNTLITCPMHDKGQDEKTRMRHSSRRDHFKKFGKRWRWQRNR